MTIKNSPVNPGNYIRTSRTFPTDPQALSVELSKTYIDLANQINSRISGVFAKAPSITGSQWYLSGDSTRQQTLRQVYTFTAAGNIPHGINTSQIAGFVAIYGTFTDGSVWYPLPYVDATAANNQISLKVTSTNIVITTGGGTPPTITSGFVVLEWLSQV